jgi:ribosomal protein S18 acetylase RimI-like enzyme
MIYEVVREPHSSFMPQAVRLHHDALSYRSFITSFGVAFLETLYEGIVERDLGFLVVAHEADELRGFILACADSGQMMSVVTRKPWRFLPRMISTLVRRPCSIAKLVQTLSYSRKEGTSVKAELVVIAVSDGVRSRGIGAELVKVLDGQLKQAGVERYKVTVHEEMERSNRFYRQLGFRLENTFEMYGTKWNLYIRDLV